MVPLCWQCYMSWIGLHWMLLERWGSRVTQITFAKHRYYFHFLIRNENISSFWYFSSRHCGLRMRRECQKHFARHRLKKSPTWPLSDKKLMGFLSDSSRPLAVMHVRIANPRWGNTQFYVLGKMPMKCYIGCCRWHMPLKLTVWRATSTRTQTAFTKYMRALARPSITPSLW